MSFVVSCHLTSENSGPVVLYLAQTFGSGCADIPMKSGVGKSLAAPGCVSAYPG